MLLPQNFYFFVSKEENIKQLNKKNAKFQDAVEIVTLYIENAINEGLTQEMQYNILKEYLVKYIKMYQLIFANLFLKYFGKIDNYGINAKIEFNTFYTSYLNQKNLIDWQKSNKYWDEFAKKTTPSWVTENNSDSICEIEIKEEKEEKKEEKEIKKAKKNRN